MITLNKCLKHETKKVVPRDGPRIFMDSLTRYLSILVRYLDFQRADIFFWIFEDFKCSVSRFFETINTALFFKKITG